MKALCDEILQSRVRKRIITFVGANVLGGPDSKTYDEENDRG